MRSPARHASAIEFDGREQDRRTIGMIKTLVSLNADLASSIAFQYSCRLKQFVDMNLRVIHVEEVEGHPPGSGWVRSTWERGLIHTAREEISQLMRPTLIDRSAIHMLCIITKRH